MKMQTTEIKSTKPLLSLLTFSIFLTMACTPKDKELAELKNGKEQSIKLMTGSVEPHETRGAPYPPAPANNAPPNVDDDEEWRPVPYGPRRGNMQPANPPVEIKQANIKDLKDQR